MSHQYINHVIRVDRDTVLSLFLGCGKLSISHQSFTIEITEIFNRHCIKRNSSGAEAHRVKLLGNTDIPGVTNIEGSGILTFNAKTQKGYTLDLQIELHDAYE